MHELNIPPLKVWVRREFMTDHTEGFNEYERGVLVSARTIGGNAMLFQVLLENGVLRDKLPIHALCHKKVPPIRPFHHLQLWNCFSANASVLTLNFLAGCRVDVRMKDNTWEPGTYLFTFQWAGDQTFGCDLTLAEDPSEHKSSHFIELESGEFAIQPNNRLRWYEPSFVTKPYPTTPMYKTNTDQWNCEMHSKWTTEDTNNWQYGIKEEPPK